MSKFKRRKKYSIKDRTQKNEYNFKEIALTKMAKRQLFITMLSILGVTLFSLGSAYAVFSSISKSKDYNVIKVGTLNIDFGTDSDNTLSLNGKYPESDAAGRASTPYQFTIKNTGSMPVRYKIKIVDDEEMIASDGCGSNQLPKEYIKYSLGYENRKEGVLADLADRDFVITSDATKTSLLYQLRIWISEDAGNEALNKHYHGKIVIEAEQIDENNLFPDLAGKQGDAILVGGIKNSSSITFDGLYDYMICGMENYDFGSNVTMVIRLNPLRSKGYQEYFNNFDNGGFGLRLYESFPEFEVFTDRYIPIRGTQALSLNTWYTIVGTYDGANVNLYVDGIKVASKAVTGSIKPTNVPMMLGANPQNIANHFVSSNIEVSKAVIYDKALSAEEISTTFGGDFTITDKNNLLLYYDFS